jgi:hypothetical protein
LIMDKSRTTGPKDVGRMVAFRGGAPVTKGQERLRLEADGQTHRRDCECARCEAGFTPSERDRELASRRAAEKQGRLMAARAVERRREKARLAQTELRAYFRHENAAADAEVQRLRAVRAKVLADRRLDELLRLRKEGWDLGAALAEIDRRLPPEAGGGAENDNARGASEGAGGASVIRRPRASGDLFS